MTDFTPRTGSWFAKLPPGFVKVGVSLGIPKDIKAAGHYIPQVRELAPGSWFNKVDPEEYFTRYMAQLAALDPHEIVDRALTQAGKGVPVLCCWEPTVGASWCHRGLISAWLHDGIGMEVREVGREADGFGWAHPKLHPDWVKPGVAPRLPAPPAQGELPF